MNEGILAKIVVGVGVDFLLSGTVGVSLVEFGSTEFKKKYTALSCQVNCNMHLHCICIALTCICINICNRATKIAKKDS